MFRSYLALGKAVESALHVRNLNSLPYNSPPRLNKATETRLSSNKKF